MKERKFKFQKISDRDEYSSGESDEDDLVEVKQEKDDGGIRSLRTKPKAQLAKGMFQPFLI